MYFAKKSLFMDKQKSPAFRRGIFYREGNVIASVKRAGRQAGF